ncbi:GGDEF domain-containing protein [Sporosarcina oncorhynchi]|uniref:GGDEF domain-containing protein n=1 Tax=Sporosarcina oncorhynchi TaxID=3056444 RepID=A0ABZ0L3F3_9BACL|nr:GGDEF domain-containing protein [Sporosarcina sp. T2O-4]WOV87008.1 GGDEF domain-containing protein [Sporosarcina sp. T2O-4]
MDEQLDRAPCGFFVLNKDFEIIEMNQTLKNILQTDNTPIHFQELLTLPSRVYFQTYFLPAISVYKQVREMYLNFKLDKQSLPVLVNVNEHNGLYEGIIVKIKTRDEYETQMLAAKKNAERIQQETDLANEKLMALLKDVECKQRELEELNSDLQTLAARDELTGLCNRRVFRKDFAHAIMHAEKENGPAFSLAILDIDHFKKVNDQYGHAVGDEVLIELAQKMESIIPKPHLISRIGGEEFAIIFYEENADKAVGLAEELRQFVAQSKWESVAITISVGITRFRKGDSANSLFTRADDALYESKGNGRNRITSL